jgi:hypothetical protein
VAAAAVALLLLPQAGEAKKFRYAAGPRVPEDTLLSVAQPELEPIVRQRGPRVPLTNLQLASLVANAAFDRALESAPLQPGTRVLVAPAASHPLNFVVEHAVLLHLSKRGIVSTVRRSLIPDDSLHVIASNPGEPVLEYTLASARVTYLRLTGWLPGRVNIERQALVEGTLTLRDPRTAAVLWVGEARYNLVDRFRRHRLPLVEDERFADLKSAPPSRNLDKVFEPVVVVAVVAGLVALFFQNRP